MIRAVLISLLIVCITPVRASADGDLPPCPVADVKLELVDCEFTAEQLLTQIQQTVGTTIRYRVDPMCVETQEQPVCVNHIKCETPPNTFKFHVFRSEDGGATWKEVGSVCLGEDQADSLRVITAIRILREFKKIDWPEAELVIQPPNGKTLVNLKTNLYTTTTEPRVQRVEIFGHQVDIEAMPTSYTWHFGDGATASGPEPGGAYPDLKVTHVYVEAGIEISPSVDVTYSGRWRVDGGQWRDIDQTLTVPGTPVDLQVLSATPHLVG